MTTEAGTFIGEEEQDRFLTADGTLLDEDQVELRADAIVDTLQLTVPDTLRVLRPTSRSCASSATCWAAPTSALLPSTSNPALQLPTTALPASTSPCRCCRPPSTCAALPPRLGPPRWRTATGPACWSWTIAKAALRPRLSYLDVEEDFAPEVGFVPRTDIRRFKGSGRYRPRPAINWIRMFSLGPRFTYLTDRDNTLQSRDFEFSAFVNLEVGDWFGGRYRQRYELLDEAFAIRDNAGNSPGRVRIWQAISSIFSPIRAAASRAALRTNTATSSMASATAFPPRPSGGSTPAWGSKAKANSTASACPTAPSTPTCSGTASSIPSRPTCSCAASCSEQRPELVGGNFLFNYRYLPGSDLFLVYNQVWDTAGGLQQASRSLQLKLSYYWQH